MAFTYCTECGKRFDDQSDSCPYCGNRRAGVGGANGAFNSSEHTTGGNSTGENGGSGDQNGQNPYGQNPYGQNPNGQNPYGQNPNGQNPYGQNPYGQNPYGQNPYGQNPYGQNPYGQNPYGQNPYGQNPYGQNPYGQNPYGGQGNRGAQRPINMLTLVLSIVNIMMGLCGCVGTIFGIAGLALTLTGRGAPTDEEAAKNYKIALVINIVGIVLSVLMYVALFIFMWFLPEEAPVVGLLLGRFIR